MPEPLRAISLWQPWASFMVALPHPPKSIETRSWGTQYRGPLLIHATQTEPGRVADEFFSDIHLRSVLHSYLGVGNHASFLDLPRGALLGVVDLTDCRRTEAVVLGLTFDEWQLGDFEDGRTAWLTRNARRFPEPIPCRGARGLWSIWSDDPVAEMVRETGVLP